MLKFDEVFKLNSEYRRSITSLDKFAKIIAYLKENNNKNVLIDLTNYNYINPSYAVIIAAIPYIAEETGNSSVIRYLSNDKNCNKFLNDSGILKHYSEARKSNILDINKSANFLIVRNIDDCEDVALSIIDKFPVRLENEIKNELISKIYEVFSNSFTHSKVNKVFCCGYYNQQKSLIFSIYNIGIGIPESVNNYLRDCNMEQLGEADALKWAWQQGNSSLNGKIDYPRGAGFQILESFAKENQGDILVGSNGSYCQVSQKKKVFSNLENPILGTFFSMQIRKDFLHRYTNDNDIIKCI